MILDKFPWMRNYQTKYHTLDCKSNCDWYKTYCIYDSTKSLSESLHGFCVWGKEPIYLVKEGEHKDCTIKNKEPQNPSGDKLTALMVHYFCGK